ncbi:MAG: hypothetical protein FWE37_07310 [Spirochaetaceae bacterium]|nr:hypothetical protein [Spirochaetaceae bacterium]
MNILKSLVNKSQDAEKSFEKLVNRKARYLLILAQVASDRSLTPEKLDRALLNQLYIAAFDLEEFLDAADAITNRYWHSFRKSVAVVKIMSATCVKLLHIRDNIKKYYLLDIEGDFNGETKSCIRLVRELLIKACVTLINEGKKREIAANVNALPESLTSEEVLFSYQLPVTRRVRHETSPRNTVVMLATEFLNLSESSGLLESSSIELSKKGLASLVPSVVSAENVRLLQTRFHNMQSLYDTAVLGSDLPQQDKNLPVMRGHISIIYHLLEVLTAMVHYYQRHILSEPKVRLLSFIEKNDERSLIVIIGYAISYADRYRKVSRNLCQTMLKKYVEKTSISLTYPSYRGFHVRPSTLISKIVLHYGSEVKMKLYDQEYNASLPLELFRANEELNEHKRKQLVELVSKTKAFKALSAGEVLNLDKLKEFARAAFFELIEQKELLVYEAAFNFIDIDEIKGEDALSFIKRLVARYMAMGKIDGKLDLKLTFEGDKRVLEDIKILAEHGYGEDLFGNNVVLPKELAYLTR